MPTAGGLSNGIVAGTSWCPLVVHWCLLTPRGGRSRLSPGCSLFPFFGVPTPSEVRPVARIVVRCALPLLAVLLFVGYNTTTQHAVVALTLCVVGIAAEFNVPESRRLLLARPTFGNLPLGRLP
jgi:hypothetical protein